MDTPGTKTGRVTWPVTGLLLQTAKKLMSVRPLTPYPGWYFNVADKDADFMTKIRLKVWKYFRQKRLEKPITINWYDGLRFNLYLGNDLSRMLFVGGCAVQVVSLLESFKYKTYRFSSTTGKPVPAELDSKVRRNIVAIHQSSHVARALAV